MKLGKKKGKEQSVTERGKMKRCSKARENPERGNLPRWNYSLDLARHVYVQTFYFQSIDLILLCINQSLKTETEGYLNTVK